MSATYRRYASAIADHRLPVAIVDLDALDGNIDALLSGVRAAGKTLRLATKSVRCPDLVDYILDRAGDSAFGLMAYAVAEAGFLVDRGAADVLVAYPTARAGDAADLAALNSRARVSVVVDCAEHLAPLSAAGRAAGVEVPVVVEADMSLRPLGGRVHLGVHRSPLRTAEAVADLAEEAAATPGVRFHGVMGYEAQVAGMVDASPFRRGLNPVKRAIKRASIPHVARLRADIAARLGDRGLAPTLFNGGGTGSLVHTDREAAVTEVTAGSGFLCSHLFDYYRHLSLAPAALFALQVVRRPGPGVVTCHGGGYVASGEAGADRLPRPWLPEGLALTGLEGAGEVQTPVTGNAVDGLALGAPVFFRHAKAGELAEHFDEYLLVRGAEVVGRAPTYRGLGQRFL